LASPFQTPDTNEVSADNGVTAAAMSSGPRSMALMVMALPREAAISSIKAQPIERGYVAPSRLRVIPGPGESDDGVAVAAPVDFLERRGPGDLGSGALLEDRDCVLAHPTSCNGGRERSFPQAFTIRGVAEDEVEGLERARLAEPGCVPPPDLGHPGQGQRLDIAADGGPSRGVILDQDGVACPARQRLKRERAGPGEEIEHPRALEFELRRPVLDHVEQRLSHAVGSRARGEPFRSFKRGAL